MLKGTHDTSTVRYQYSWWSQFQSYMPASHRRGPTWQCWKSPNLTTRKEYIQALNLYNILYVCYHVWWLGTLLITELQSLIHSKATCIVSPHWLIQHKLGFFLARWFPQVNYVDTYTCIVHRQAIFCSWILRQMFASYEFWITYKQRGHATKVPSFFSQLDNSGDKTQA